MNILIITPWYPFPGNPVSGIFIRKQAEVISEKHNVIIMHVQGVKPEKYFKNRKISLVKENSLEVYRAFYPEIPRLARLLYLFLSLIIFRKIRKDIKIDVIHAHVGLPAGLAGIILKKLYNVPVVLTEHKDYTKTENELKKRKRLTGLIWRNVSAGTAVSSIVRDLIVKYTYRDDLSVLSNVIDVDFFRSGHVAKEGGDVINIVFIGLLNTDQKGLDLLLNAMNTVKRKTDRQLKLHIIGGGIYIRDYKEMADNLNLDNICEFHGLCTSDEVRELLCSSDFFVLPSRSESFAIAAAEAMACGIPVIVTRCGGPEEYVEDFAGYVIPAEDINALSEAILKMILNYNQFNSEKISDYIERKFGKESFLTNVSGIYDKILNIQKKN